MRRAFTLFSIVVHTIVIAAALVAQSLVIGALPIPHDPILYNLSDFIPVEIQPPAPPPRRGHTPAEAANVPEAAPIVAPTGVAPETGRAPAATSPGVIEGVINGLPFGSDTVGGEAVPPPPPPPPVQPPMRLHAGITAPRKIVDVAPVYPSIAQAARKEGVVILETVIDAHGTVQSVRVLRSVPLLDDAAVTAVRQWRFTPALLNGEPVPVVMTVTVNFKLQQ
jgi:periplasmic protein TonB